MQLLKKLFIKEDQYPKFIVEVCNYEKSLFKIQSLYSRAHADKMPIDSLTKNNFIMNNILPEQSCVVGIVAGFNKKYLPEDLKIDDTVSGVREYVIFRSNLITVCDETIEIDKLCTMRELINKIHPATAFYIGFEFGKKLSKRSNANIIPFLKMR